MKQEQDNKHKYKVIAVFSLVSIGFIVGLLYLVDVAYKNKETIEKKQDVKQFLQDIDEQKSITN
jgi:hypothetical protein